MFKEYVQSERQGFAITFELILTMLFVAAVSSITIYFNQTMELERFFADVASSTCSMASRYGGSDSIAYKVQVSQRTSGGNGVGKANIQDNANAQLKFIADKYSGIYGAPLFEMVDGKYITVSKHANANNEVSVSMRYRIAGVSWGQAMQVLAGPATIQQNFTLPSLMQNGKLTK